MKGGISSSVSVTSPVSPIDQPSVPATESGQCEVRQNHKEARENKLYPFYLTLMFWALVLSAPTREGWEHSAPGRHGNDGDAFVAVIGAMRQGF